jgi:hypothetical protein
MPRLISVLSSKPTCENACSWAISSVNSWLTLCISKDTAASHGTQQYQPILCLANGIFLAKSGETTMMANDDPQFPDVSTISCSSAPALRLTSRKRSSPSPSLACRSDAPRVPGVYTHKVLDLQPSPNLLLNPLCYGSPVRYTVVVQQHRFVVLAVP